VSDHYSEINYQMHYISIVRRLSSFDKGINEVALCYRSAWFSNSCTTCHLLDWFILIFLWRIWTTWKKSPFCKS